MKKKYIIIIVILLLIIIFSLFYFKYINSDSKRFKSEYENLNGKITEDGKKIRTLKIPNNNKIIYKTDEDIVNMINNKETFIVYFGFAECPWCRSVVPTLLKVTDDLNIDKIYYVDVLNIRDKIEVNEKYEIKKVEQGTKGYNKLLKLLDPVLSKYTITDNNGNEIDTKEKRIYAPNIIVIVDGKAKKMETGISDKLTDPYMKLTKEIKQDSYNKLKCTLKCINENNVCTKKTCVK